METTLHKFFVVDNIGFLIAEGHKLRFELDGRVESTIVKKKKKICKVTPFLVIIQ